LAVIILGQRVAYIFLAYTLFANSLHIYFYGPALANDAMVQIAFFAACVFSFIRHRLAPKIPDQRGQGWSDPIPRPHY